MEKKMKYKYIFLGVIASCAGHAAGRDEPCVMDVDCDAGLTCKFDWEPEGYCG